MSSDNRFLILDVPEQNSLVIFDQRACVYLPVVLCAMPHAESQAFRGLTERNICKAFLDCYQPEKMLPWEGIDPQGKLFAIEKKIQFSQRTAEAYSSLVRDAEEFNTFLECIDSLCAQQESQGVEFQPLPLLASLSSFHGDNETALSAFTAICEAGRATEAVKLLERHRETGEPIDSECVKAW